MRKSLIAVLCLMAAALGPELLAARSSAAPQKQRRPRRPAATKPPPPPPADILVMNGRVFTNQQPAAWAEAVAIRGERIVAVGSTADLKAMAGPATRVIDAEGRTVVPGFNDAHAHVAATVPGARLPQGDEPFPDPTYKEIAKLVAEAAAGAPKGTWIFGTIGPTIVEDAEATRFGLDDITKDHPVLLRAWTGHGTFFNTAAMKALGLSETEPDPPGGFFTRLRKGGSDRTLSGFAHEYAEYRMQRTLQSLASEEAIVEAYRTFATLAASHGITSVQVMVYAHDADRVATLLRDVPLAVRLRLVRFPLDDMGRWQPPASTEPAPPSTVLSVWGTKWILDGTPVERLAFLRQEYADRPRWRGQPNFRDAAVRSMALKALESREPIMVHAVGDAMIEQTFSAMTSAGSPLRWQSRRLRIEHGDLLTGDLIPRAKSLGVIVVQNPSHLTIVRTMSDRLGQARAAAAQPLKSLLAAGVPLALGSDGPLNPGINLMFATTHPGNPREALSMEEAVRAYTWGSAYAEFAEQEKGVIAPGMLADMAILSQDIFTVASDALPGTTAVTTIVNGRVVHPLQ